MSPRGRQESFIAYCLAALSVVLAMGLAVLLFPWSNSPTAVFTMAVVFSAWYGGLGPALLAAFLAGGVRFVIFREVGWSPMEDLVNLVVFCLAAVLIGMLFNERHRTEVELRKQQEWLRVTLASIGDAVITTDRGGCITFLNPVAERMTGWKMDEAAGHPLESVCNLIHENSRMQARNPIAAALKEGMTVTTASHTSLLARDGREIPIEDSAAPIKTSDGATLGAVMVFHDVSAGRQAEKQRTEMLKRTQEAQAQAESANRAKDEFLAVVSHELRTPLTAILGWIRLIRTNKLEPDKQLRAFEIIENNAVSQAKLIEDLLDVSRIISGKMILEMRPVDFRDVVQNAFEAVRLSAESKDIHLECIARDACPPVSGDPDRLRQIIYNLLTNAIKFTPHGGRVTVSLERLGQNAAVTVTDTGIGIDQDFLPYVFDRFRQENTTSTRRYKGLGLGLSIVRHLVELHGGTVSVDSAGKNRGATFLVQIPGLHDFRAAAHGRDLQRAAARASVLSGMRILVVEDEPDTCEMVESILTQHGATASGVHSVREAMDVLDTFKPGVLISDIGMPDEDGYALIRLIRARSREAGGTMPAIALTAFSRVEDRQRALASGFQAHVSKPVDPDMLLAEVARLTR